MPQSPSSQSKSTIKASIRGDESPSKKKKEKFEYLYSGLSNNKLTTKRTMYANSSKIIVLRVLIHLPCVLKNI